jgi:pilus assembly protein Flp/PilA
MRPREEQQLFEQTGTPAHPAPALIFIYRVRYRSINTPPLLTTHRERIPRFDPERFRIRNGEGFVRLLTKFWRDETGATAIEYGLIAAGIALAIIAAVNGLGTKLNSKFSSINSSLK